MLPFPKLQNNKHQIFQTNANMNQWIDTVNEMSSSHRGSEGRPDGRESEASEGMMNGRR